MHVIDANDSPNREARSKLSPISHCPIRQPISPLPISRMQIRQLTTFEHASSFYEAASTNAKRSIHPVNRRERS